MSTELLISKLSEIQKKLVAPKGQFNAFGKYKYRSCEDILTALKPHLQGLILKITDEIVLIGDRYYVRATATLSDGKNEISVTGMAREEAVKKGMDGSQITGAASSYARKYALNGMFLIDDSKDSDHTNDGNGAPAYITAEQVLTIETLVTDTKAHLPGVLAYANAPSVDKIQAKDYKKVVLALENRGKK